MVEPVVGNPDYSYQVDAVNNHDLLTQLYNKSFFMKKLSWPLEKRLKQH